ncbi:MAG: rod shape-determining protein, partial [Mycobacterium leprae]
MLLDIGSGTTNVSVISLGGVVVTDSCEAAGDQMDEAIVRMLKREYNLMIGPLTAERLKMQLGAALPEAATGTAIVAGRLTTTGNPAAIEVRAEEVYGAISETLAQMESLVLNVFERTPPELLADISRNGLTITGGGSLLRAFDERLHRVTRLPVHVTESPLETVAMGARKVLEGRQRAKLRRIKP